MHQQEELLYIIALKGVSGLGDKSIQALVAHMGSAKQVYYGSVKELIKAINKSVTVLKSIRQDKHLEQAQVEIDLINKHEISAVSWLDDHYPRRLKQIPDKPCLLFYKGEIAAKPSHIISIVGTRNITSYGRDFLNSFFKDLQAHQPIIVSGLAYGVDALSHQLALQHGLPTYGILAHGLCRIYPTANEPLAKQIITENGALVTECFFNAVPDRENFPKRNRIVAGLSDATLVIESDIKGGSMITARLANDYNREVMAVPGSVYNKTSKGCNQLIKKNMAHVLTEPNDLVSLMNWDNKKTTPVQTQLFLELTKEEQHIYDLFQHGSDLSIDQIAAHMNRPSGHISVQLLGLEMKGAITPLPGARFKLS
jgi:DNA processing protein